MVVELNCVQKTFGKEVHALNDLNLSLTQGKVLGLFGHNGAGKTTCFYMIVNLVNADEGTIMIDDEDITDLPMHGRAKKGIGYLPQEASIFRKLTVANNILALSLIHI